MKNILYFIIFNCSFILFSNDKIITSESICEIHNFIDKIMRNSDNVEYKILNSKYYNKNRKRFKL